MRVREGLALLLPEVGDAAFYGGSGVVTQYWNNQLVADAALSPEAAYQRCVADYSVAACS